MDTLEPVAALADAWWASFAPGAGTIDLRLLAPDLDQPRKHILDNGELEGLRLSIREHGIRYPLIITPSHMAPWVRVRATDTNLPFRIVAGHRRRLIGIEEQKLDAPAVIRHYDDELTYREDASITNAGGQGLTPLEQGWEAARLRRLGMTLEKVVGALGLKSTPQLYNRIHLTRLPSDLQALLSPKLLSHERLSLGIGGTLGSIPNPTVEELRAKIREFRGRVAEGTLVPDDPSRLTEMGRRHALQRLLLGVVTARDLPATVAVDFIKTQRLDIGSGGSRVHLERREPRRQRDALHTFLGVIEKALPTHWERGEWERIFDNATVFDAESALERARAASRTLAQMVSGPENIVANKKAGALPSARRAG